MLEWPKQCAGFRVQVFGGVVAAAGVVAAWVLMVPMGVVAAGVPAAVVVVPTRVVVDVGAELYERRQEAAQASTHERRAEQDGEQRNRCHVEQAFVVVSVLRDEWCDIRWQDEVGGDAAADGDNEDRDGELQSDLSTVQL